MNVKENSRKTSIRLCFRIRNSKLWEMMMSTSLFCLYSCMLCDIATHTSSYCCLLLTSSDNDSKWSWNSRLWGSGCSFVHLMDLIKLGVMVWKVQKWRSGYNVTVFWRTAEKLIELAIMSTVHAPFKTFCYNNDNIWYIIFSCAHCGNSTTKRLLR